MRTAGRIIKDRKILREIVKEDNGPDTRTRKVLRALEEICRELDIPVPIWLEANIREFQRRAKTAFTQDAFVEEIPFTLLELEVLEED